MRTIIGKRYNFSINIQNNDFLDGFVVSVSSVSGKLNTRTGYIIEPKELDEIVHSLIDDKFANCDSIFHVSNLEYLPHTLEVISSKLFDWIEERLPHGVTVYEIKVLHRSGFFVKYKREDVEFVREVQPQKRLHKRRKK